MALTHPAYGQLRQVTETAAVVLASNPGMMTIDGTNTWILRAPGSDESIVVDPGPRDRKHSEAVAAAAGRVVLTLVTHWHHDHTGGIGRHHRLTGSPIRALDDKFVRDSTSLSDGEVIEAAGVRLRVVRTPGHTEDSLTFELDDAVLTGDTILGRGTTVLSSSETALADYLGSLERIAALGAGKVLLPAHGPDHRDTAVVANQYLEHRRARLDQVREALNVLGQDASPMQVVRHVYRDVDKKLWIPARSSVKAQLAYLRQHG